jgi:hypothetical protein
MNKQKDNEFQALHFSQAHGFKTLYVADACAEADRFRPREEVFIEMGFKKVEDFMLPDESFAWTECRRYAHEDGREILHVVDEAPVFVDDYAEGFALKVRIASLLNLSALHEMVCSLSQELHWLLQGRPSQATMVVGDFLREGVFPLPPPAPPTKEPPARVDPEDESYYRKKRIRVGLVELSPEDDTDSTHYDPLTGVKYTVCSCCDLPMDVDLGEMHSGGECNLCHAMNKDD